MRFKTLALGILAPLLALGAGCNVVGAMAYYLGPHRTQKAEFNLTAGRLALIVDNARPSERNPVFDRALYDQIVAIFKERKVKSQVVPFEDVVELRRSNADFDSWSLQRVGKALDAEQVLYLRIEHLAIREAPDSPVMTPTVAVRVKVIGTDRAASEARLWPTESEGRPIACSRPTEEVGDAMMMDTAATKLAKDTAQEIAKLFYEVDLEEHTPKEH